MKRSYWLKIPSVIYVFCLLLTGNLSVQPAAGWITVEDRLKGFQKQLELENMSGPQYLPPPTSERIIIPGANPFK